MTFEKILEVFDEFIAEQDDLEIVKTSNGYVCLEWRLSTRQVENADNCATPEELLDYLLDFYETVLACQLTMGVRDYLTVNERRNIQVELAKIREKVNQL